MAFQERIVKGQAYRVLVGVDSVTSQNIYEKTSFWTSADDVEFRNGKTLQNTFEYASGTLLAGETTVTITGNIITANGMLDIYVPNEFCRVHFEEITNQRDGSVTITFPVQTEDMEVRVLCH